MAVRTFVKVDTRGVDRLFAELADNDRAKFRALTRVMQQIGFVATDEFMEHEPRATSASPSKTKLHRLTGRLTRSLIGQFSFARGSGGTQDSVRQINIRGDDFRAIYGTKVFYAKFHEFGTRIHPARPFLKPAAEKVARDGDIERIFAEEIRRHVRRSQN